MYSKVNPRDIYCIHADDAALEIAAKSRLGRRSHDADGEKGYVNIFDGCWEEGDGNEEELGSFELVLERRRSRRVRVMDICVREGKLQRGIK